MTDPASAVVKLTSQLVKIHTGLKSATGVVEQTLLDLESLDLSVLSPAKVKRKGKREHPVRCDVATLKRRLAVLSKYRQYKTGEALNRGWRQGDRQPWSHDAITDTLALLLSKPKLDSRRIYDWKGGQMAEGNTASSIEHALCSEIERMQAAGIKPTGI